MRTGMLLEELINIAQTSKIDYAIYMNMTPSGLSKILTGKRLPFFKEKREFSKQSANYFAQAIYSSGCYAKFEKIFPVIYDFTSIYELEIFLTYALEYALGKDYATANNADMEYPYKELSFLGKKTVLNMFCIIISDYIINDHDIPLEFYSTLPLFNQLYSDIFQRLKITALHKQKNAIFNHYFAMPRFESAYDDYDIDFLSVLVKAQQHVDLNLWQITKEINYSFLLLKGKFLFLLSIQMDGTPLMTFITHKGYITVFFNSLSKKEAKKISYSKDEAIAALENDPLLIDRLIDKRHILAVYNYISIGYLVKKEELVNYTGKENLKKNLLKLFNSILTKETNFFVTLDAMMGFSTTGKAIVPLIGVVDIPPNERVMYLKRFTAYINENNLNKIRIVNREMPKVAVLCADGLSLIYQIDSENKCEKIHVFQTDMLNNILAEGTMERLDFSADLWNYYIDELSKNS